jgi:hypothetical protein
VKTCFKCLTQKPLSEFYRHAQMGDGHLNKCKECTKKDATATRLAKIDYYRSYDRRRASMPHRVQMRKGTTARYKAQHPNRRAAHVAVGSAVKCGRLVPLPCFLCGDKAEAHHVDYDQPLQVIWLCPAHHKQAHAMARKAA